MVGDAWGKHLMQTTLLRQLVNPHAPQHQSPACTTIGPTLPVLTIGASGGDARPWPWPLPLPPGAGGGEGGASCERAGTRPLWRAAMAAVV